MGGGDGGEERDARGGKCEYLGVVVGDQLQSRGEGERNCIRGEGGSGREEELL